MEHYEKILTLSSRHEATLMEEVLKDKDIPHAIIQSTDSMFGGIEKMERGWGYLEAPAEYRDKIIKIYEEISK